MTPARIFFAGIGTTFLIVTAGFGGGVMFAKSALSESPTQTRASSHQLDQVRVILPTTAEAAPAPQPAAVPEQQVSAPELKVSEKPVERVDTKKAEAAERAWNKRYAERKARKIAAARQRMEAKQQARAPLPSVVAFGGDEPRTVGFFGN